MVVNEQVVVNTLLVVFDLGGTFGANHHLRQSLVFLNVPAMPQPEAYLGGADKLFDTHGTLTNDSTRRFLQGFVQTFGEWITANSKS